MTFFHHRNNFYQVNDQSYYAKPWRQISTWESPKSDTDAFETFLGKIKAKLLSPYQKRRYKSVWEKINGNSNENSVN